MMGVLKKAIPRIDLFLLSAIIVFSLLLIPFLTTIPYLDGNIEFLESYSLYTGGFGRYFQQWHGSVHPPFKLWLENILYGLFGIHPIIYNSVGLLFALIGIIAFYHLVKTLIDRPTARISTFLLVTSPLFLANALFDAIPKVV